MGERRPSSSGRRNSSSVISIVEGSNSMSRSRISESVSSSKRGSIIIISRWNCDQEMVWANLMVNPSNDKKDMGMVSKDFDASLRTKEFLDSWQLLHFFVVSVVTSRVHL